MLFVFNEIFGILLYAQLPNCDMSSKAILAQLVERIHGKDEVPGSIPRDGSIKKSLSGIFLMEPSTRICFEKKITQECSCLSEVGLV